MIFVFSSYVNSQGSDVGGFCEAGVGILVDIVLMCNTFN
jgi:hypothetical protein